MFAKKRINIWYVCGLSLCNFDCAYCASGQPGQPGSRTNDREWLSDQHKESFEKTLEWISRQNYRIGLRLQTIGEPMVSADFLRGAARMTQSRNIRFVELVTNGSLLKSRLPKLINEYGADKKKLLLWITYHHTEIDAAKLVEQACFARDLGVEVNMNSLVFPDNQEKLLELQDLCLNRGLPLNTDVGHNYNRSYPGAPFFTVLDDDGANILKQLQPDVQVQHTAIIAAGAPYGRNCSAGHDYIFIAPEGNVYPCKAYMGKVPQAKLGSALDDNFSLELRKEEYIKCEVKGMCTCKEDYLHMEIARSPKRKTRSMGLGYSGKVTAREEHIKRQLLKTGNDTKLIKVLQEIELT